MFPRSQNLGVNQPKAIPNRQGYSIDLAQMNNQIKNIKTKWSDYNSTIQKIQSEFLKLKQNAVEVFEYAKLHCEKVKEKDGKEVIEEKEEPGVVDPLFPKQLEENSVKDNSNGINGKKQEPQVVDPKLPENLEDRQKLLTYTRALEMMAQKEKYFKGFKEGLKTKSKYFEDFHVVVQNKMKRLESLSSDIFEKSETNQKMEIINEISLSDPETELHDKCCELYNEVVRDHNTLRINYGFPENSDQNDVDEIEKKADSCINLCKKLNLYPAEKENTVS